MKLESKNELKGIEIKNRTCYIFITVSINNHNLINVLLTEKSYENVLIYDFGYKNPYCAIPLHIIFDKVERYIRKNDGTKYLA